MSEVLGHKTPSGPRNNTWPNREQSEQGMFGVLGDSMPFDPAGESRYCMCATSILENAVYHVYTFSLSLYFFYILPS